MCDVSNLFYKVNEVVEGYLGDPENCKALFVLREPHAKKENVTDFWFKKKVLVPILSGNRSANNMYYKAFHRLAQLVIDTGVNEVLLSCAFINAFPFCGEKYASAACKETIEKLRQAKPKAIEGITIDSEKEDIAANRRFIVENISKKIIFATCDIFEALVAKETRFDGLVYTFNTGKGKSIQKTYSAAYLNSRIIIAIYHPSYQFAYRGDIELSGRLKGELEHS